MKILVLSLTLVFSIALADNKISIKTEGERADCKNKKTDYSPIEKEIVDEINLIRENPKKYIKVLESHIKESSGKWQESKKDIQDLKKVLSKQKPMNLLEISNCLSFVSQEQADFMGKEAVTTHLGKDSASPNVRINRALSNSVAYWGENLYFCAFSWSARDIVIGWLLDVGIPDKSHRNSILSKNYNIIGVGYASHKTFGTCTVVDFAN